MTTTPETESLQTGIFVVESYSAENEKSTSLAVYTTDKYGVPDTPLIDMGTTDQDMVYLARTLLEVVLVHQGVLNEDHTWTKSPDYEFSEKEKAAIIELISNAYTDVIPCTECGGWLQVPQEDTIRQQAEIICSDCKS